MFPIKICGISNRKSLEIVLKYPVSSVGFIFYSNSPRFINQSKKRLTFYNRCKYDINITDIDGNTSKYVKKKKSKKKIVKIEDVNECLI